MRTIWGMGKIAALLLGLLFQSSIFGGQDGCLPKTLALVRERGLSHSVRELALLQKRIEEVDDPAVSSLLIDAHHDAYMRIQKTLEKRLSPEEIVALASSLKDISYTPVSAREDILLPVTDEEKYQLNTEKAREVAREQAENLEVRSIGSAEDPEIYLVKGRKDGTEIFILLPDPRRPSDAVVFFDRDGNPMNSWRQGGAVARASEYNHQVYDRVNNEGPQGIVRWKNSRPYWQQTAASEASVKIPDNYQGISQEAGKRVAKFIRDEWASGVRGSKEAENPEVWLVQGRRDGKQLIIIHPDIKYRATLWELTSEGLSVENLKEYSGQLYDIVPIGSRPGYIKFTNSYAHYTESQ